MQFKQPEFWDSPSEVYKPALRLFSSDLEEIFERARVQSVHFEISDMRARYDDLADLRAFVGPRVREVEFAFGSNGSLSGLHLELTKDEVAVSCFADDPKLSALFLDVVRILERRKVWFRHAIAPFLWPWLSVVPFGLWLFAGLREPYNSIAGFASAGFYFSGLASQFYVRYFTGLFLQREHEVKGFFASYGPLLLALLTAILTTISGVLLEYIKPLLHH